MMGTIPLADRELAFTGRLVSMSRAEAIGRIAAAGGRHARVPGPTTDFLVAGQGIGHLTAQGEIARNMALFRELKERGVRIRLMEEPEFLEMLGAENELADFSRMYTAVQVSRIVEAPLSEVRAWLRKGLLKPARTTNRLAWFGFKDILLARNLSRLIAAGVPKTRIRKSLEEISRWLPDGESILERMEAYFRGLRVRLSDGGWGEPNGQRLMDFGEEECRGNSRVSPFPEEPADRGRSFSEALDAEMRGNLIEAAEGYARALEGSPEAETYFNLGNVLYELGREGDAAERYLQALEIDHEFIEAWNNLGNCLVALNRLVEAVRAYEKALSIEPGYPDAHCNLATVLERLGGREKAAAHRAECEKAFPGRMRLTLLRRPAPSGPAED